MVMLLVLVSIVIVPKFAESAHARTDASRATIAQLAMSTVDELGTESGLSAWVLAGGASVARDRLAQARQLLDQDRREFLAAVAKLPAEERNSDLVVKTVEAVNSIDVLRGAVDGEAAAADDVFNQYVERTDAVINFIIERTKSGTNPTLVREGTAITEYLLAKDQISRQRGEIVQKLQANSLGVDDFGAMESYEAAEASHMDGFVRSASAEKAQALSALEASAPVTEADAVISDVRAAAKAGAIPSVTAEQWWTALSEQIDAADVIDDANFDEYLSVANTLATEQRNQAIGYLIVGILAALGTACAAAALARSLVRGLRSVAGQAQTIASERLPEVLDTLRNPTPEALAKALPEVRADSTDEIGVMADAFNQVLRTSVETAMDHAQQRARTVTDMLVNLGRRNQSLIDRQLELMDELESRQEDPDVLERLFRIDHLITRMRRNAENLVVLAGQQQARSWSEAVAITDVLRGAASEAPDLNRIQIDVQSGDNLELAGPHAVDVSHLIAELIENATAYSSPATRVVVRTEKSSQSLRVWIIDAGVGMAAEELIDANARLASPPDIDSMTTDRVGFQVVGRLARQLGVTCVLQSNPGGGLAACVNLPLDLFELTKREPGQRTPGSAAPTRPMPAATVDDAPGFGKVAGTRTDRAPAAPSAPSRAESKAAEAKAAEAKAAEAKAADVAGAPTGDGNTAAAAPAPAGPTTTASGLVKRTPGGAFAGNEKAAAADAGAFRRLPTPGEDGSDEAKARRFQQISQLQSAVFSAREDAETETSNDPNPEA